MTLGHNARQPTQWPKYNEQEDYTQPPSEGEGVAQTTSNLGVVNLPSYDDLTWLCRGTGGEDTTSRCKGGRGDDDNGGWGVGGLREERRR